MTTWNSIIIENAPADFSIDNLPDGLSADGEIWEDREVGDDRHAWDGHINRWGSFIPARPANPDGVVTISGRSKYHADAAEADLIELSKRGARVTWSEEWDDDEVGRRTTVYVNGEYDKAASHHDKDVPDNLGELVEAVRAALNTTDDDPLDVLTYAASALVDALRPEVTE